MMQGLVGKCEGRSWLGIHRVRWEGNVHSEPGLWCIFVVPSCRAVSSLGQASHDILPTPNQSAVV